MENKVINDKNTILAYLQQQSEMEPDEHDGSYELMRKVINAYSHLEDLRELNYLDLNLIYHMCIGTWEQGVKSKACSNDKSHLLDEDKEICKLTLKKIWNNANELKYVNARKKRGPSIGMFGTGFFSFKRNVTDQMVQDFISMLIDIQNEQNEEQIFKRCEQVLTGEFKGMKAASASEILHCYKPFVFPVLNANTGKGGMIDDGTRWGNIYDALGIKLSKRKELKTYIENCREIKSFRDSYLPFKNYRIIDIAERTLITNPGKCSN